METFAQYFSYMATGAALLVVIVLCVSGLQGRDAEKEHEKWQESKKEK